MVACCTVGFQLKTPGYIGYIQDMLVFWIELHHRMINCTDPTPPNCHNSQYTAVIDIPENDLAIYLTFFVSDSISTSLTLASIR